MTYDSSFTRTGIGWPKKSPQYQIWALGMATFPIHGTDKQQITMDYNFYYTQRQASSAGVTQAESDADSAQVLGTYDDMYNATYNGNRAPLILGNHFNAWNNNAYETALTSFVLDKCGQPDTYCVPFRDLHRVDGRAGPGRARADCRTCRRRPVRGAERGDRRSRDGN